MLASKSFGNRNVVQLKRPYKQCVFLQIMRIPPNIDAHLNSLSYRFPSLPPPSPCSRSRLSSFLSASGLEKTGGSA